MTTRNWSIRTKIVALVSVPLLALLALWIFATSLTIGPALNLLSANTLLDSVGRPGEALVSELQKERRLSVVQLSGPADAPRGALVGQRAATDRAIAGFRASAGGEEAQDAASGTLRDRIRQMFADLDGLSANRGHIDARQMDAVGAQNLYNEIINTGFAMFSATARFDDEQVDRELRALTTVGRGQEFLSRADSLLAGGNAAGQLTADVRNELFRAILTSRFVLSEGVSDMPAGERTTYQRLRNSETFSRLDDLQDTLISDSRAGAAPPVTLAEWQPAYDLSVQQLRAFELNATEALGERTTPIAVGVLVRLGIAGLLGLVALVVSIAVSVRLGRSIIGRLRRLRAEALEMAGARLPQVVSRLRRGELVDVEVETPPLEYGNDEIGEVGHAFNDVQRTAVQSAVDEAGVRRGMNEVFLNIARRSQTLLHRQLALLDRMERRETGAEELEDLYRVDHLATRMRRHAEDLVILAGAAPGRGWRNPVPVIDVIRGAISEVEDYKRIDVHHVAPAAVLGRAVGDIIHLLAELLENAASFSPPNTRVMVSGQELPNGYALEIEDRGLGMSLHAVDEANRTLTEPPDFDPKNSARLGLFVVSQLAHRNGVKVALRQSAYGGVTAVVLVPDELITAAAGHLALPAGPAGSNQSWDRPLVGTGLDDPNRRGPAALQWQGGAGDGMRSAGPRHPAGLNGTGGTTMPLSRRPTGNGAFGMTVPKPRAAPEDLHFGPAPSTVADGFTPEGLIRRRRNAHRQAPPPDTDRAAPARSPEPSTPEGLPRRVRQASLAPQLRDTPPDDQAGGPPLRSPEQVRTIMSALQRGTSRGRQEAAEHDEVPRDAGPGPGLGSATTLSLPVFRDRPYHNPVRPNKDDA
ncbi:MAG TPA: nitrate- and nitrite sensing domain-containing protein [Actinoplanes sp.]|nr:nitrate- and nitrite sensing domain-containing protein [Actinoplanes sp.]